jgi:hypothetical protein
MSQKELSIGVRPGQVNLHLKYVGRSLGPLNLSEGSSKKGGPVCCHQLEEITAQSYNKPGNSL